MQNTNRQLTARLTLSICLVVLAVLVPRLILGERSLTPKAAPAFSGQLSQYLASKDTGLPVPNKDYSITETRYFDNNTWALVSFKALHSGLDGGYAIFSQSGHTYKLVLGPGTAFSKDYLTSLPTDLVQDLNNLGVVYESSST